MLVQRGPAATGDKVSNAVALQSLVGVIVTGDDSVDVVLLEALQPVRDIAPNSAVPAGG